MDVNEELKYFEYSKKKKMGGGGSGEGSGCGCERRIEVFGGGVVGRGRVGGVRVDVNEIEVFVKIQKKKFFWGGGGSGGEVAGGSGSGWGVRVDVNEELKFL